MSNTDDSRKASLHVRTGQAHDPVCLLGQAVEYLLGDGSEDARSAFESQLESDQGAREALADAVSIVAALRSRAHAAKHSISVPARKATAGRLWIKLAVAVSLMLAVGWWYAAMQRSSSFQREEPRAELAIRWSELRSGDADAEFEEADASDSSDLEQETPSWIVAGLIGLRDGVSDSVPPRPEEF